MNMYIGSKMSPSEEKDTVQFIKSLQKSYRFRRIQNEKSIHIGICLSVIASCRVV